MKSIDAIIPLFNCEHYIKESIQSIQSQTYPVNKIIVVDDGSTDNSASIVECLAKQDPKILLLRGTNHGLSAARNKGIRAATADFIAFLDADDIWLPDKLAEQMMIFSSHKDCAFIHTQALAIAPEGTTIDEMFSIGPFQSDQQTIVQSQFNSIRSGEYIVSGSASSVIARRNMIIKAGLFDETMRFAEDWDMWARLAELGDVAFIPKPLVKIRVHPQSMQRSIPAVARARSRLNGRIAVASHWENDNAFLQQHRQLARQDAWNVIRWLLLKPALLASFYKELRNHRLKAGRVVVTSALDYLTLISWGITKTLKDVLTSPAELKRLWGRLVAERKKAAGK